jgi:hypothetical protein
VPTKDCPNAGGSEDDTHSAHSPGILRWPQVGFSRASRRTIATVPAGMLRRSGRCGRVPFLTNQVPIPAQQGVGFHEEPPPATTTEEPTQFREQRSIRWSRSRSGHVAAEDGNLVAEHDDLNCQITTVTPTQAEQLEDSDAGEVQKRQCHGPGSSPEATGPPSR